MLSACERVWERLSARVWSRSGFVGEEGRSGGGHVRFGVLLASSGVLQGVRGTIDCLGEVTASPSIKLWKRGCDEVCASL